MKKMSWYCAKLQSKIRNNHEILVEYYRKKGVRIGEDCLICSDIESEEPFLISIGSRCVISTDVTFVTHDFSISRVISGASNIYGEIIIGDNCFIGAGSILMYGIELPDNVIVAAGSVVVNSFKDSNIVIGGNPARIIGTWDGLAERYEKNALLENYKNKQSQVNGIKEKFKNNPDMLVKRRII